MRKIDLTGQRFGKLLVIGDSGVKGVAQWICKCDCGNVVTVFGMNLTGGRTSSCGCSRRVAQGDSLTKLYQTWTRMGRSGAPGRDWPSYADFKEWALANGYVEGAKFKRINLDRPFGPTNCVITLRKESDEMTL